MGGTAIDLRWTRAQLGGSVRAAAIVREAERASAMPTLRIPPDLYLHYVVDDFTDPWSKPSTVLMLHGNAESGAAWYGWMPELARRHRVVRPDMRGFGQSTPMPREFQWSLDGLIDDYCRLMDVLGVERFHLVGAKIGGTIARAFAARRPERVLL
jgi:3-oxoadipate enol-lactonase